MVGAFVAGCLCSVDDARTEFVHDMRRWLPEPLKDAVDISKAWWVLHVSHRRFAALVQDLSGVPVMAPGAAMAGVALVMRALGHGTSVSSESSRTLRRSWALQSPLRFRYEALQD